MSKARMKPSIPDVVARFAAYYQRPENGEWGSLHVVLSDKNLQDAFVRGCAEWAAERGDAEGVALAEILLTMSKTQRGKLSRAVSAFIASGGPPANEDR